MNIVKFSVFIAALFAIGWFVSFQYDPYRVCKDHPEADKKKDFYLCEPGGFTLQKSTRLERPEDDRFIWEKRGDVIIGTEDARKKRIQQKPTKEAMDEWECNQDFYTLSPSQLQKINIEDYCSNKKEKTFKRSPTKDSLVPNGATEEL